MSFALSFSGTVTIGTPKSAHANRTPTMGPRQYPGPSQPLRVAALSNTTEPSAQRRFHGSPMHAQGAITGALAYANPCATAGPRKRPMLRIARRQACFRPSRWSGSH